MKQQIRKKVFETNSSSSHSLTLSKGDLVQRPFTPAQLRDGTIEIALTDYGWEYYRYYSAENKIRYLLTQLTHGKALYGTSWDITRELCEDDARVDMLVKVVREHTGCDVLVLHSSGSIDHQSQEKGVGLELFNNPQTLRDFLFNPEACVQTGNDNNAQPWQIDTDRGMEFSYEKSFAKVPKAYATARLTMLHNFRRDGFSTGAGGILDEKTPGKLFEAVLEQGVVVRAESNGRGSYNAFSHREPRGHLAQEAVQTGFRISSDFVGTSSFEKGDAPIGRDELITYVVRLPQELSDKLAALDPKGRRNFEIAEAKRELKYWHGRLAEKGEEAWAQKQVDRAKATLLKAGGKKVLSAYVTVLDNAAVLKADKAAAKEAAKAVAKASASAPAKPARKRAPRKLD